MQDFVGRVAREWAGLAADDRSEAKKEKTMAPFSAD